MVYLDDVEASTANANSLKTLLTQRNFRLS